MRKTAILYTLRDHCGITRYVGITIRTVRERLKDHRAKVKTRPTSRVSQWLSTDPTLPVLRVEAIVPQEMASQYERHVIRQFVTAGEPLLNTEHATTCGTLSGDMAHRRAGEPSCKACLAAKATYEKERRTP